MKKRRVGVLFGGRSAEHEVSLKSARAVLAAIDRDRFEVVPIGVTKNGRWLNLSAPAPRELVIDVDRPLDDDDGEHVGLLPMPAADQRGGLIGLGAGAAAPALDVVLPLIHGTYGEDGTLQGLLELADVAYVGSGVLGSAVAMDKTVMKALLRQAGLPVSDYQTATRARWRRDPDAVRAAAERALGYPLFVKPANCGSSVGVHKVRGAVEFAAAMDDAAQFDGKILLERAVENAHEIEIAVLGNDEPRASVAGEIVPSNEFYDYQAKYHSASSELIIPAPLPDAVAERLRRLALDAFRALDCAGLARIDFLVRRDDYQAVILEANTLPGFTPISMYPKLWQASGLRYDELITTLIELALERHADRRQNRTSYD